MRRRAALRVVRPALPIDDRCTGLEALPPRSLIRSQRDVGVERVVLNHLVSVAIGLRIRARHHTEITRLGIDRPEPAIFAGMQPGDVISESPDLPTLV